MTTTTPPKSPKRARASHLWAIPICVVTLVIVSALNRFPNVLVVMETLSAQRVTAAPVVAQAVEADSQGMLAAPTPAAEPEQPREVRTEKPTVVASSTTQALVLKQTLKKNRKRRL